MEWHDLTVKMIAFRLGVHRVTVERWVIGQSRVAPRLRAPLRQEWPDCPLIS
jgi:plasmid maintenance system antidote protein VapI